jgi:hypothetical protein
MVTPSARRPLDGETTLGLQHKANAIIARMSRTWKSISLLRVSWVTFSFV